MKKERIIVFPYQELGFRHEIYSTYMVVVDILVIGIGVLHILPLLITLPN